MTTSEGGMITSDDAKLIEKAIMIRSHGSKIRYYHDILGFNLRMTDISAAIGLAQLKKVDSYNDRRIKNAMYYNEKLKGLEGIVTPMIKPGCKHVFHQYTIRLTEKFRKNRDETVDILNRAGIGTGIYYPLPIHQQRLYKEIGYDESHPVSEELSKRVISLPVHPSVTEKDIDRVVEVLGGIR
jgi:dTDP-4-amino-4,6-dideoxygalactose transaminase